MNSSKKFDVYGFGHGIVDVFVDVSEEQFAEYGFEKGSMNLVAAEEQHGLLETFSKQDLPLVSGGSVANSVIVTAQLGGSAAMSVALGDDRYGMHYKSEFDDLEIDTGNPIIADETTGTCVVLVTPDAERTMRTHLGIASQLSSKQFEASLLENCQWLFVEGYLLSNGDERVAEFCAAAEQVHQAGGKVALTFSDGFIVDGFRPALDQLVKHADLIFANENEATRFTGCSERDEAFEKLSSQFSSVAMTLGADGAQFRHEGQTVHAEAVKCKPVDLTGAGDVFAGSLLFGITNGFSAQAALDGACRLAGEVVQQYGARLRCDVPGIWKESASA